MAATVAPFMPTAAEIAACQWLTEAEVEVYATEYARTGFTGALQGYRVRRGSDPKSMAEMHTFSGRTIDVPSMFIAGKSDWGTYQTPGARRRMRSKRLHQHGGLSSGRRRRTLGAAGAARAGERAADRVLAEPAGQAGRIAMTATHLARTLAVILLCCSSAAFAETFPTRGIKVVVPFSAAGVQDIVTRIIFDKVSAALGQPVIVENRPGAGGTLAMAAVAASPPDGYMLVVSDPRGSLPAAPSLYQNLSYDPRTSFEPIAMVGSSGAVLSVGKDFPAATLGDLVKLAKARPGELTFGSAGNATPGHLNGERFKRLVGIDVVHVPYRMISQAVTDLMTTRISFWISPVATVLQQLNTGQLRALAVAGDARLADLPDVPTIQESGFGEFDASTAYAFFAPAGTPAAVVDVLTAAIETALQDQDVRQRMIRTGVTPKFAPPQTVRATVAQRVGEWAEAIQAAGIKPEAR